MYIQIFRKGGNCLFRLNAMGMDMRHTPDFIIDRPNGSGDCLLIIFKTNALLTSDGAEQCVPPDSAVIYPKDCPQLYRACGSYVNHYLHFSADGEDCSKLRFGTLLTPGSVREAEEIMRMLGREQLSGSPNRDEYISMLIKMLLMKLSEPPAEVAEHTSNPYAALLDELRAEIYTNPGRFGSVSQMASELSLSPSHFQQLYRSRFSVSCYEDLLSAKIGTAQYYLSATDLTIRAIADLCGYKNDICFMHRFKERTGMTPTAYRKRLSGA